MLRTGGVGGLGLVLAKTLTPSSAGSLSWAVPPNSKLRHGWREVGTRH